MAGDVTKFTGQNFFLPAIKLFLQKQAVITTTMTEQYSYNVFNLSFTLLTRKKATNRFIDLYCNNFTLNLQINLETTKIVYFKFVFNDIFLLSSLLLMKYWYQYTATGVSIKCIFLKFFLLIIAIQHYSIIESHYF